VTGVFGFGDIDKNGYNVMGGVELFKRRRRGHRRGARARAAPSC
jgi:hypothetical protein